ncbi:MAG: beta-propeller fold lactonase family protein [Acidobacteriota bacterium]|nr:beta-propeller fold lactonase family protein [Acidobacteriota bacterium]
MNFKKLTSRVVASAVTAGAVLGLSSCTLDYTVAYVYATASNKGAAGVINQYGVDLFTGALIRIGTPVATGVNPVAIVATSNGLYVYVLNHDDSTVQEFAVQADGSLASKGTTALTVGTYPTAAAIDQQGKFLYVTYTYQTGYSASNPGPGGVAIFPIGSDYSLGTPTAVKVGNNPVSVVASNFNNYVYVLDQETAPNAAVLGFAETPSSGALTPLAGTTISTVGGKTVATGYSAGTTPSAIAEDPTARWVYVTDQATNQLYGKVVQSNGSLLPMVNGPFATGLFPVALTIDPRGKYLFTVNYNASSVGAYAIDLATGNPSGTAGSTSVSTKTNPTSISIEPALGIYAYITNSADGSLTGEKMDPHTGALGEVQGSPFPATGTVTAVATVANGAHATQIVQP